MYNKIDLEKQIQVLERGKWVDVSVKEIGEHRDGRTYMTVMFGDLIEKTISDIFNIGADMWRYREKCCEQCIFCRVEGEDVVPCGSTTCSTPEEIYCDCPDAEEGDTYEELEGGIKCNHFVNICDNTGLNRTKIYNLCVANGWCTCCSCSQYSKLFKLIEEGASLDIISLVISMFSSGVSKEEVKLAIRKGLHEELV